MHRLMIVDDEESVRYSFKKIWRKPDYEIIEASSSAEALATLEETIPDLIILDIQMPVMSGLELLQRIKSKLPKIPVLVITAYSSSERVIAAMKYGAYEYIEKPFDIPQMKALVEEALEAGELMRKEVLLEPQAREEAQISDQLIGNSAAIKEVCKMIGRVAPSDVSVLLVGESGTGKELVARAIYQNSARSDKLFLAVNCAAIPETLLESELFGYERGAFTGANKRKIGKFEQADGGTIFLDEIGDMSLATQAKLLRVLQEGTFERLGGEITIHCTVRLIAATNQNLEQLIRGKKFREDLYYRIKVITITLPPLRMRRDDLPELVDYFMAKHLKQLNREHVRVSPAAMNLMKAYDWPGNIRELENVLKRSILLSKGSLIHSENVAPELHAPNKIAPEMQNKRLAELIPVDLERHHGTLYETVMSEVERELIIAALKSVKGNQVRAAQLLGISRVMLHDRIQKYSIKTDVIIQET
ncbi:sigma-54-dependent Fis family transcriptional regulator [candidate division KSB1 bacterium]|nr:sigma-54-dependent Fis family transcriptional regulator [candidate division KSB1 bacterium]